MGGLENIDLIAQKGRNLKQLLWVGMGGITMFFAGLTSAYIVRKAEGGWLEFEMPSWFWASTVVIVLSSVLLIISKRQVKNDKTVFPYVCGAFILGLAFACFQVLGWNELKNQGVFLTGQGSNVAGSFLYVITLAHLLHLIGGLISLLVTSVKVKLGRFSSTNYLGIELSSIYWHFLDVLWLYLFFFMKYL
jgi:cytochrome c oxidase subunit 3